MTEYNVVSIRQEDKCQTKIKEVNFRETDTQFVYRGIRGIVIIDKSEDVAETYVRFIEELKAQFNPTHMYHQFGNHRFEVPQGMDRAEAEVFLDIIKNAEAQLTAVHAA